MQIDTDNMIEDYLREKILNNQYNVNRHITQNNHILEKRNVFYDVIKYIDQFLTQDTYHRIISLPGLRGVGKTTILFQIYDYLLNKGVDNQQILYLNTEQLMGLPNADILKASEIFIKNINKSLPMQKEKLFILVDEAQYDPKWAKCAKIIYDEYFNTFMIFTGSSTLDIEMTADAVRRIKRIPIYPMKFGEYVTLRQNVKIPPIDENINNLILNGDLNNIHDVENDIYFNKISQLNENPQKMWDSYLKYGGFGYSLNQTKEDIIETTVSIVDKTITKDMHLIKNMNVTTEQNALKIIKIIAMQKPGDISESKLADILKISSSQVRSILYIFEKTHLLHHIEAYGSPTKRTRKSWKYYFLSPTIKYSINRNFGFIQKDPRQIMGSLSEDLVASLLYQNRYHGKSFEIFYAPEKGGVDFLLSFINGTVIPVEVGYGKKSLKQVYNAIEKYNSPHGILISNRTTNVYQKDNIICIPLMLFSM